MRQRSQTANALRAHMAELGIIAGTGMASIAKLLVLLRDEKDNRIPGAARFALILFAEQIELLTTRIEKLDREILVAVRKDPDAKRLMSIPGVGPLIAATVRTSVLDARNFATARDFAAWTGLTTEGTVERRKRKARRDIKAWKSATTDALDRWCDLYHQAC
ncbi:transposase [Bradyrhizobium sp. CW7]|nr:transposase [Bradyrhizobium sp. CW7]